MRLIRTGAAVVMVMVSTSTNDNGNGNGNMCVTLAKRFLMFLARTFPFWCDVTRFVPIFKQPSYIN